VEVSHLQRLRIVAPAQLNLHLRVTGEELEPDELWEGLPEATQSQLLSLFARLIARSVITNEEEL
jgi:hypothetical protein